VIRTLSLPAPLTVEAAGALRCGDVVYLTGTLITAREKAHRRLLEDLEHGRTPVELEGAVIYYTGPSPLTPQRPIGSAGPSSAARMDPYTPRLLQAGVRATIGKGMRSQEVKEAHARHGAVYCAATGGAGALLSLCIRQARPVAYLDLGQDALHILSVEKFPVVVVNDCVGGELYAAPDLEAALHG
jgi:fumarate hydratase subunit beta